MGSLKPMNTKIVVFFEIEEIFLLVGRVEASVDGFCCINVVSQCL